MSDTKFRKLLQEQLTNEFQASHQYVAIAAWFDQQDLPQLAGRFYQQAQEEHGHAMMMVRYLLDNGETPQFGALQSVRSDFAEVTEPISLALQQEKTVTGQITELAKTARDEGNYLGEQFIQWFIKEQMEEEASMSTLLTIAERAKGNLFHLEDFIAREVPQQAAADPTAPAKAGSAH